MNADSDSDEDKTLKKPAADSSDSSDESSSDDNEDVKMGDSTLKVVNGMY